MLVIRLSIFLGGLLGLSFFSEGTARAQEQQVEASDASFRLHGLITGTKAVAGYQSREFGWGGAGLAAIEWGPSQVWGIQAEFGFVGLGTTDQEAPGGLAELEGATGTHLAIGLRGRPLAEVASLSWGKGLWGSAALGATLTGGAVAPVMDAFVGYDFFVNKYLGLGPAFGYMMVLQTRDTPRPGNAHLLLAGMHGSFDFGSKSVPPPVDRDFDGILNAEDACPDDPEDKDGFQDIDGCPDLDNDEDKIPDVEDRCPIDAEDWDEFEDDDGCPDTDNDKDDVPDVSDQCPLVPEDRDEFEDEDGCPDIDNDNDGIVDTKDLCPNEPETKNGIADNDGCPDAESVRVVGDKIELDQKIHFWTNSDRIRGMSYPVIHKLGRFLIEHTEYVHVDIEGHADQRGKKEFNLDLSRRRAASIKTFLIDLGMSEERLSSDGFGSTRPLVEGENEHAWFMNRRVEFVVTRNRKVKFNAATGQEVKPEEEPVFGRDKKATASDKAQPKQEGGDQ